MLDVHFGVIIQAHLKGKADQWVQADTCVLPQKSFSPGRVAAAFPCLAWLFAVLGSLLDSM